MAILLNLVKSMLVTCSDHERFADRVPPKYFADDTFSSGV